MAATIKGASLSVIYCSLIFISFSGPSALAAKLDGGINMRGALIGEEITIGCLGAFPRWKTDDGTVLIDGDNGIEVDEFSVFTALTINKFTDSLSGNYTCFDSMGSDNNTDTVTIFNQGYSLTIDGSLPHIEGDSVNLACVFISPDKQVTNYRWIAINANGTERNLSNTSTSSNTLFIDPVPVSDSGAVYQCHVTVTNVADPFIVSVNINITAQPVMNGPSYIDMTVLINESSLAVLELPCNVTGDQLQYSWTIEGAPVISGSDYRVDPLSGSLSVLGGILYVDDGRYSCNASNKAGTVFVVYDIVVEGSPNITTLGGSVIERFIGTGMPLSLPCLYQSNPTPEVTLGFQSSDSDSVILVDPSRYSLTNNGFTIESLTVNDNGVFYCTVTNTHGMANITYTVIVHDVPVVSVSSIGSESVNISLASNSQSGQVDFYRITLIRINSNDNDQVFVIRSEMTWLVIDELVPNAVYQVYAVAVNEAGDSGSSERITFTTDKSAPKFHFFNITSLDGGRSLRFDWLLLFDGGSQVDTFTITVSSLNQATPIIIELIISAGSHVITGLEPNVEYNVQTSLTNEVDTSLINYSVTTARGPPLQPTQPSVSDVQLMSVVISFDIPSIGSEQVDYYSINIQSDNVIKQTRLQSNHSRVITVTNNPAAPLEGRVTQTVVLLVDSLDSDTLYSFSVAGGGAAGQGPFSEYSDTVKTGNAAVLYYIVGGVLSGSVLLLIVVAMVILLLVIIARRKKKRIGQKHSITDRIHEPTNFGFPNSSISENVHTVEEPGYSPPSSSMEDRKDEIVSPPPYPGYFKVNHHRTLSVSSTTSSQMYRKPDYLRSPTDQQPPPPPSFHLIPHPVLDNSNDSAYGGSADKGVNHIYHQIPPKGMPVDKLSSHSFPSINRVASYDVDQLPPRLNCATDV